jgi:hypothetical protein
MMVYQGNKKENENPASETLSDYTFLLSFLPIFGLPNNNIHLYPLA